MEFKYQGAYKCRICGKLILCGTTNGSAVTATKAVNEILHRQKFASNPYLNDTPIHYTHTCDDGSVGICDFIGLKRIQEL